MKKIFLFLPTFIFFAGAVSINLILKDFSWLWFWWVLLFLCGGLIMSLGKYWGALAGFFPAAHLIYMSTQYTGQVINIELPLEILLILYYTVCGYSVLKKEKRKKDCVIEEPLAY